MWNKKHVKEIFLLAIFLVTAFGIGISSTILNNQARNSTPAYAATDFDQYCRDGVYYVKSPKDGSEISCGRAPNCDDTSYEDTAGIDYRSNGQCWIEDYWGGDRCKAYCAGYVPLCCYKMAETKNAEDCAFPERGYCMRDQCKGVTGDSNCGAQQGRWCVDIDKCVEHRSQIPKLSLEDRLAGRSAPLNSPTPDEEPSSTPTSQPTPTTPPQATVTPRPANTATPNPSPTTRNATQGPTVTTVAQSTGTPQAPSPTTQVQAQQRTPTTIQPQNNDTVLPPFELPKFEPPKIAIKDIAKPENIEKVNKATDPPLTAIKDTFVTVQKYDQKIEVFVERYVNVFYSALKNIIR